jgi:hypothetical protein
MEATEVKSFSEVLNSIAGKVVTVINPESFRATPLGYKLDTQYYKGKVKTIAEDYVILLCEWIPDPKKKEEKETVTQYIPVNRIKRISILSKEILFHM